MTSTAIFRKTRFFLLALAVVSLSACAAETDEDGDDEDDDFDDGVVASEAEALTAAQRESLRDRILADARKYKGWDYKFGSGPGDRMFDCSEYVQTVFRENGISLPRTSRDQATRGVRIAKKDLKPGDLIFFRSYNAPASSTRVTHVAIYAGNDMIWHTFRPGIGVTRTDFDGQWDRRFIKAKRVIR